MRQLLAVPFVFVGLGLARAAVMTMPFRTYASVLGRDTQDHASGEIEPRAGRRARRIGRLIEQIAQRTPWRSNCLAQALVAAVILRALGIRYVVHFGVSNSVGSLASIEAHSWVMAGDYPVTGYRESQGMTCVSSFRNGP
ncbi:MAG: lasso peptide biosynthesis B2 protein [Erythrobacter sp.]|nr:lasso peptide biosynthesis B2 protein [Erythrobacter sp.]